MYCMAPSAGQPSKLLSALYIPWGCACFIGHYVFSFYLSCNLAADGRCINNKRKCGKNAYNGRTRFYKQHFTLSPALPTTLTIQSSGQTPQLATTKNLMSCSPNISEGDDAA